MKLGEFMINQLNGGITKMDGGAIFGVIPKPLWSKSIVLIIITKFHLLHILYLFRLEKKYHYRCRIRQCQVNKNKLKIMALIMKAILKRLYRSFI